MGQCAPSSTSYYSPYLLDEDEVSFVATPLGAYDCHGDLPLRTASSRGEFRKNTNTLSGSDNKHREFDTKSNNDAQNNFLRVHRPDIPQRSIVDQSEVKRVAWLQSDELLRRHDLLKMDGKIIRINANEKDAGADDNDDQMSIFGEHSEFEGGTSSMVSGVTSASNATVVRTNTKNKFKNETEKSVTRKGLGYRYPVRSTPSSPSPSVLRSVAEETENHDVNSNDNDKEFRTYEIRSKEELLARARTKLQRNHHKALNVNKVATIANNKKTRFSDQPLVPQHYITETDLERNRCMSVLRLKIKANISWFYTQRYLMLFPDGPKPIIGRAPKREGDIPDLTSESSDNSFSSSSNSSRGSSNDHTNCSDHGAMPPTTPVKCSITNEPFLDLAITGCLGLVPREQDHNALRSSRRQLRHHYEKSPDHYVVLINKRSGSPLAVCAMKATSGSPVVRIYATRQRVFAQKPAATTQQLGLDWADDLPLYAWAEVISEGDLPDKIKFSVFMAKRSEGCFSSQPSYKAIFDGSGTDGNGVVRSPVIKMMGRTDNERTLSGCALISIQADEMMTTAGKNVSDLSFHIDLAQGMDPAFFICFTAVVDEIIEKSMRMQCKNQTRIRIRKDSFSLTKQRLKARAR